MKKMTIVFVKTHQDSQELGSDDEHMVSRVFFTIKFEGSVHEDCSVDVKQTVGSSFEDGSLEVSNLIGWETPMNWMALQEETEGYYRTCVGANSNLIHVAPGGSARMWDNVIFTEKVCEIEVE